MNRRHFLASILGAAAVAQLAACVGDVDDPNPDPGSGGGGGGGGGSAPDAGAATAESFVVTNTDSSGHGHSFQIQCAHATEDGWTYTAGGAHTHSVSLTSAQLQQIFAGQSVTVQTSDGHAHTWVIARPADRC